MLAAVSSDGRGSRTVVLAALVLACGCQRSGSPASQSGVGSTSALSESAAPADSDSAEGAANVVRAYYWDINERRYEHAYRLWASDGAASGKSLDTFRDGFENTASVGVELGTPGRIEGRCGLALRRDSGTDHRRRDGRRAAGLQRQLHAPTQRGRWSHRRAARMEDPLREGPARLLSRPSVGSTTSRMTPWGAISPASGQAWRPQRDSNLSATGTRESRNRTLHRPRAAPPLPLHRANSLSPNASLFFPFAARFWR